MTRGRTRVADVEIGPIEAKIEAADVEAYQQATTLGRSRHTGGRVPATFPAIWLWHPRAAAAIAEASRGERAPVLIAQRFEYRQAMAIGQTYQFTIRRFVAEEDEDLVAIEASVHCLDGSLAATFSASYRMFANAECAA